MRSIRRHLWFRLVLGLGALWCLGGGALFYAVRRSLDSRLDSELRLLTAEVQDLVVGGRGTPADRSARRIIDFFVAGSGAYFQAWDPDGVFSDRSPSLGDMDLPRPRDFGSAPLCWDASLSSGERIRVCASTLRLSSGPAAGAGYETGVVVARNREDTDLSLARIAACIAGVGMLSTLVSVLVVTLTVRSGLDPLRRLGDEIARVDAQSLGSRFSEGTAPCELHPVIARLNSLVSRLESSFERERRFSADLAHELRTPLAEIKAAAECALRWPDEGGQQTLREVLQIVEQMQTMAEDLLALARTTSVEAGTRAAVRLAELVSECWEPLALRAEAACMDVSLHLSGDVQLPTHAGLLRMVVQNLLTNAVEHGVAGGRIRIEMKPEPDSRFCLCVGNTVRGLKVEDIPHLFERFWRKDPARSAAGHHGLGLSLAQACAQALGYDLTAALEEGDGEFLTFRLCGEQTGNASSFHHLRP